MVPAKLAIVADWLNHSISYVDVDKLATGTTRDAVISGTISLPNDLPGPMVVTLTPDRKTALVAVSTGFFSIPIAGAIINQTDIPSDPGMVLFLDVDTGKVTKELITGKNPTDIVITPDGTRAFVTNFGDNNMSVVDLATQTVTATVVTDVIPEELALDETGTVGVVGDSTTGNVHTFSVANPTGPLGQVLASGDSGGIAFFPGTKIAYVVQAPNGLVTTSGYTLIDVSDPTKPQVLQDLRLPETPIGFPVVAAKARNSVLVPATVAGRLVLREYKLVNNQAMLDSTLDIADATLLAALGISYDGDHTALLAWPSKRQLVVVDLNARTFKVIPWIPGNAGPAGAAFR